MYCTATVLWESGHDNRQATACCVSRSRVFRDSEPVQDVLLVPGETQHGQTRYHLQSDNPCHHVFLDWDDDMQPEHQGHHIRHCPHRLDCTDHFLAGPAAFAATGAVGA
jgi:hypothetical protein